MASRNTGLMRPRRGKPQGFQRLMELLVLSVVSILLSAGNFITPGVAQDYYAVLGLERSATRAAIRKALKKKRAEFSPNLDQNIGEDAIAEKYEDVIRAEDILLDQQKRQWYDRFGIDELEKIERGSQEASPSQKVTVGVELEDLYKGKSMEYDVKRKVICESCHGTGAKGGQMTICPKCKGHGKVLEKMQVGPMVMQVENHCNKCGGRGKTMKAVCPVCNGNKLVQKPIKLNLEVKKGMSNREQVIFHGQGEMDLRYREPGDIVFHVRARKHHKFRRVGNNLYTNINISFKESLLGFTREIKTLDGRKIKVTVEGNDLPVRPFGWYKVANEGMPKKGSSKSYGDLMLKWQIAFPKSLTPRQKQYVKQIFPMSGDSELDEDEEEVDQKAEEL